MIAKPLLRLVAASLLLSAACKPALAKDVWFEPLDNLTPRGSIYVDPDYPELFTESGKSGAAWASGVSTFAIEPTYAIAATDAELQALGSFLATHRMALNITLPMLPISTSPEPLVEGYTKPGVCLYVAMRFQSLGIAVASVSADEPLTWGHYYAGPNAAQLSIPDTARAVGEALAEVRQVFPDVALVDYEAPSLTTNAQFAADLPVWLAYVKAYAGTAPSMLVFDADWTADWQGAVTSSLPALSAAGVKAGIFIIDNDVNDVTAEAWYDGTLRNEAAVKASGIAFATKILANWTAAPTVLLPKTGPYAITTLLPGLEQSQRAK